MTRYADAIDLSQAQIVAAPGDIASWPADVAITQIDSDPGTDRGMHIETTPKPWPTEWVIPGMQGPIQYTVWMFRNLGGRWVGSGFIQMWGDNAGGPAKYWTGAPLLTQYHDWVIDQRWAPMNEHQPAAGEMIGIMLSVGNARGGGTDPVVTPNNMRSRSNVVLVPLVSSGSVSFPASELSPAPNPPGPLPPAPPSPQPPDGALSARVKLLEDTLGALINKVDAIEHKPDPVVPKQPTAWKGKGRGSASLFGARIPLSVDVVVDTPVMPEN